MSVMNQDMAALRDYVTQGGKHGMAQAESTVLLTVTHSNLKMTFMELRFDRHMSVSSVKNKLYTHCGTNAGNMALILKNHGKQAVCELDDDSKMLGYYSPEDGWTIHVVDTDPNSASANGWLEDTSKVDKYVISDEDYAKRENNFRSFKEAKLAQDPTWSLNKEMAMKRGETWVEPVSDPDHLKEATEGMEAGMRCEVEPGSKRGTVRYVGQAEGLPKGYWVGVEYDEPVGKNDGSVKGKRYFECNDGYGGMIRPDKVKVGDFPPVDDFDFSDPDEI